MYLAIPFENGNVNSHFGHSEFFRIYQVEAGQIKAAETIRLNVSGHDKIPEFLKNCGVTAVICGGMGEGMKAGLARAMISVFPGVTGSADQAVKDFLDGTLKYAVAGGCSSGCGHHDHGSGCHSGGCGGGCCGH